LPVDSDGHCTMTVLVNRHSTVLSRRLSFPHKTTAAFSICTIAWLQLFAAPPDNRPSRW